MVFDTNTFVSALALPAGRADEAVDRVVSGEDAFVVSRDILRELLDVLARKFERDAEQLARVALFVAELGELVDPRLRISVLGDDADNRILECAAAGNADVIVTGDRAMLQLVSFEQARIITLRSYLERSF